MDNEQSIIPLPSRQEFHNDRTDFALDPALIFDQLPQPFRLVRDTMRSKHRFQGHLDGSTKFSNRSSTMHGP
jgi:hypothetical protein